MSTKLNAEELAAKRFACVSNKTNDYGKSLPETYAYAAAIREHSQPLADEAAEYRDALERLYNSIDSCMDLTPELMLRTRAILDKYKKS